MIAFAVILLDPPCYSVVQIEPKSFQAVKSGSPATPGNQGTQVMPLLENKALNRKSKTIIFEIFTRYANVAVFSS